MTTYGGKVSEGSTTSTTGVEVKGKRFRQRPLGPAPFASFEDSSDELDSPPESARAPCLPNIKEDPASQLATPVSPQPSNMNQLNLTEEEERGLQEALAASLDTPAPPRIDISRASSSSQHEDSITSSPDNENGHNLGYKEDGALELKSSTEELYYVQEPGTVEESEAKRKRERRMQKQVRQDCDTQSEHGELKERKDSNCSVVSDFGGHLYIGGRSSRLSSVGSAASGNSIASGVSHLSGASRLSVGSKMSRGSRSPSPHKMMLETSFCGGRPATALVVEAESAPALVSHMEKPTSRPPSRLRSRSPSPHKVLLETSFCGPKAIGAAPVTQDSSQAERSRPNNTTVPEIVTKAEISAQPSEVPTIKRDSAEVVVQPKAAGRVPRSVSPEINEIRKADDVIPASSRAPQRKPVNLAQMMERKIALENKPKKKIISIRDIPGDEIFIPLTGPEIDFEELIRSTSPSIPQKDRSEENPDIIFIPLHSPPKEKADDTHLESAIARNDSRRPSKEPKPYEKFEDGSIYIPLHTPEEEKSARTFEEEIKRVERELQRVREQENERREREQQRKPATLGINESINNKSRLSQSYPGKQELLTGSRTPSPGSSLSRKSSFASIFHRSELTASPDPITGHHSRKKSLSNIIKDATDSLRERSRSRSKERSREMLPSSTNVSRSPSFKKSTLGNLFGGKKKDETRPKRKSESDATPRQTKHTISTAKFQGEDMGDYILIPLKDPSDHKPEEAAPEEKTIVHVVAEVTQEILPRDEPIAGTSKGNTRPNSKNLEEQTVATSMLKLDTVGAAYQSPAQEHSSSKIEEIAFMSKPEQNSGSKSEPQEIIPVSKSTENSLLDEQEQVQQETIEQFESQSPKKIPADETSQLCSEKQPLKPHDQENFMQDSSVELEDDIPREEIVTVSTDGVKMLQLPPEPGDLDEEHERKGLVVQDSLEEELPYVPTTLPLERSFGVTLVPAKERVSEVVTCPIDRPRSTTPKNPASLEEYLSRRDSNSVPDRDKMKISLPRVDSLTGRMKSPRRSSCKGKSWVEFAEAGIPTPRDGRKNSLTKSPSPPPLPPRAETTATPQDLSSCAPTTPGTTWINFEELPEKRKLPKRITTLPVHRAPADGAMASEKSSAPIVYSFVNPEDCQCECHETGGVTHHHQAKNKLVTGALKRGKKDIEVNGDCNCVECDCAGANDDTVDCEYRGVAKELEERPLLEGNSDDESISRPDNEWIAGSRLDVEQALLSDSSFETISIGPDHSPGDNASELIPFAMDLDVHSNRSSVTSKNGEASPEENT